MRKFLMIASAAAMAVSMPAVAKEKGGGGGKPEKHQGGGHGGGGHGGGGQGGGGGKEHKEHRGGGGGGGGWERHGVGGGDRHFEHARKNSEKRFEERRKWAEKRHEERGKRFEDDRKHAEKRFEERRKFAEKRREAREKRFEQREKWAEKAEKRQEKAWKQEAKRERFVSGEDRREFRRMRGEDRRLDGYDHRYQQRYADNFGGACPPGLAKKNNGCLPPGQAKKMYNGARYFSAGQVLPLEYYSDYNIPSQYQSWYQDSPEHYYRYDDGGYIYQVDRQSNLIESLIPLLGGGFGVGQLLPAGFDAYNLPMQYRDDYQDSDEAYYRYGDDAIYQVDPQTNMIESIVALLAGDLNVGSLLPSGYDTYNLPMEYRDQYVDDEDSMYRYADGNIYEVDPQTQIIEQIVASLV
jgi:hypothetical protein